MIISFILSAFILINPTSYHLDKKEAKRVATYLNEVRVNPSKYNAEIPINMKKIKPKHKLKWDERLAAAAEKKALDMAKNNYFSHTDKKGNGMNIMIYREGYKMNKKFIDKKSNNYFESISAGQKSAVEIVNTLIEDKGVKPPNHRNHLLGIDDFWANCTDIGVGFAKGKGSRYSTYICILIAKHDF